MERPFGVTLLASFFLIQSVINVVIVFGYYTVGGPLYTTGYYVVASIAGFAIAYGLWGGHKWGKLGMMAWSGWEILLGFLELFITLGIEPASPVQAMTKVIVYAIVIYFLNRPEIADYFKSS
ncbi:MAG: hypothetical protein ABSA11_06405 [Candidatus Bathyarchaeia archaeon]|jgi:hypothetical protein